MLRVWGLLDLLYFAYYVTAELSLGRIPFLTDFQASQAMAGTWRSAVPPVVTALSVLFVLSLLASGYALLLCRRYGRFLVYGQLPFRLLLVMPSVFFLPWLVRPLPPESAFVLLVVLVLCTEAWKAFSVYRGYRYGGSARRAVVSSATRPGGY